MKVLFGKNVGKKEEKFKKEVWNLSASWQMYRINKGL